jgi:hypothetical protein
MLVVSYTALGDTENPVLSHKAFPVSVSSEIFSSWNLFKVAFMTFPFAKHE